jgi:hypothetical protein
MPVQLVPHSGPKPITVACVKTGTARISKSDASKSFRILCVILSPGAEVLRLVVARDVPNLSFNISNVFNSLTSHCPITAHRLATLGKGFSRFCGFH